MATRRGAVRRSGSVAWLQALLALISLAAFRAAQIRWQPDALATCVPGLLSRLLLRPFELPLAGLAAQLHGHVGLQAGTAIAILITTLGAGRSGAAAFGRRRQLARNASAAPAVLPNWREKSWN
ncbi:hypothetical protein [Tropicimonas sp. IMCC34043]|uniref:hypothetical protein n=1 Tax=Tropicimonas sp. IMCC34043 TaxID=2248760 RepID=UPI001E59E3D4|nr:hypothetical protein [Tropicimonas sp. IMCC34043]